MLLIFNALSFVLNIITVAERMYVFVMLLVFTCIP